MLKLSSQNTVLALMHIRSIHISVLRKPSGRAGLTIGQTGQMPRASRIWGPRAWMSKHSF